MQDYINELKSFILNKAFLNEHKTLVQYTNELISANEEDRLLITQAFFQVYYELTALTQI